MSHHKSGQQKAAESIEAQDAQQRADQQNRANQTLGQFQGPVEQSPFYKALLTTGTESTSRAYDRARANTARRAQMAGFGYEQPVTQGAQTQVDAEEASALAQVPQNSLVRASQPALQAGGVAQNTAMGYGNQEMDALSMADQMQQRRRRGTQGLFSAIANVAPYAAAPFTGGTSLAG